MSQIILLGKMRSIHMREKSMLYSMVLYGAHHKVSYRLHTLTLNSKSFKALLQTDSSNMHIPFSFGFCVIKSGKAGVKINIVNERIPYCEPMCKY